MTRSDSPPDLGIQLRAGDESVLEAILRTHGPPILALLKQRYSGRLVPTDYEDILAAALYRVWQHRTRFDPALASLRVWFFRIAENTARDVLKHGWHKARQLETSIESARVETAVDRHSLSRELDDDQDDVSRSTLRIPIDELRALLARLPDQQRRIVLADADSPDGLVSSQSLAKELSIPASTVRVYRRRALERLRHEIEQRELAERPAEAEATP